MAKRPLLAMLAAAGVMAFVLRAEAAEPTVVTRELGSWDEALAALRDDLHSQGRTVHLGVRLGRVDVMCGAYRLTLDAAAARALRLGECDIPTGETPVTLVDRRALFDDADVPRPRALGVDAIVTLRGTSIARGTVRGGSTLRCGIAVQPYLDDQAHGTRVALTPDKYELRLGDSSLTATPTGAGWSVGGPSTASLRIPYWIVDRATGTIVLEQEVALRCGGASTEPEAREEDPYGWRRPARSRDEPPPPTSVVVGGTVRRPPENQCRWGGSRKGGCRSSPYGLPIGVGIFMGLIHTGATAGFVLAGTNKDGLAPLGWALAGPGVLGLGLFAPLFVWSLKSAKQEASRYPAPSVSVTRGGATFGLATTF